ncbi:MAG: phosphoethanolamine transferase [Pseudomonadota bacterium]
MSIIDTLSTDPAQGGVRLWFRQPTPSTLTVAVSAFVMATANLAFFGRLVAIYPFADHPGFVVSTFCLQVALLAFLLAPAQLFGLTRPLLALVLLVAAPVAFFQDRLGIVIEEGILRSILATDSREALDLMSLELVVRTVLLGVVPAWLLFRLPRSRRSLARSAGATAVLMGAAALVMIVCVLGYSSTYTNLIREHKIVRYYSNPLGTIVAVVGTLADEVRNSRSVAHTQIATDAELVPAARPRLVVMVLGETARAGNLSLNGYERETNPRLEQRELFSFRHVASCATETAQSVPCLFSLLGRSDFSVDAAANQDNLLDVLKRAGVNVLWRDNNSDSKQVALRVPFEDYRFPANNPECAEECRDVGMLDGLDEHVNGDTLIVLHQMGSHGPAYYKRYPAEFEVFKPACKTNELSQCSRESIVNAYDNTILYTDYFLDRVITFLESKREDYDVAMLYVSDHGESLGEYGVFLHGMPYVMAPEGQTHVPLLLWLGDSFAVDRDVLRRRIGEPTSHDAVFGTVLKLLGVRAPSLENLKTIF